MDTEKRKMGFWPIFWFLLLLFAISYLTVSIFSISKTSNPYANVAVIKIYGDITTTGSDGFLASGTASNNVISLLDEAEKDSNIHAIVLDINSGGGSPVASEEIGNKLKSINKTKVAWIRDVGASGAYWIASSTDHVVASRMSLVGSIGVIGSYLEFAKLIDNYNITYVRIVSGKYKDTGSPFKNVTPEEEKLMQDLVDEMYGYFTMEVAVNRNLSIASVKKLATGEVFTGAKGKELGLVDEVGGLPEVSAYLEKELNTTVEYAVFEEKETLTDLIRKLSSEHGFSMGRGIGSYLNNNQQLIRT